MVGEGTMKAGSWQSKRKAVKQVKELERVGPLSLQSHTHHGDSVRHESVLVSPTWWFCSMPILSWMMLVSRNLKYRHQKYQNTSTIMPYLDPNFLTTHYILVGMRKRNPIFRSPGAHPSVGRPTGLPSASRHLRATAAVPLP